MTIHVVRHARAGDRQAWAGPDRARPLSKAGRHQADALAERLVGELGPDARILTSPFLRCRQTVEPLATKLHVVAEVTDELAEGSPADALGRLLDGALATDAVLCTHGDVVHLLLDVLARTGVPLDGDRAEKASTWVLSVAGGRIVAARHVAAPAGRA